ncbi:PglZ domain protein [Dethiosulfovibrio peptidovorans DSM 11002]|uniref:PglZ domain protein n=1 Tax=Dethiosulfovibrio peptidovorans DSM 11002 TaxID=469381 RepID=D2Z4P9_9BACT|nr:BREX-3 system phosphatase PglZ [Dethiosulfovibrio peptidovorans]EFC92393.1 PglZ domain protein [Dethiosulfovibrio peptidovorans DSM 11002]
MSSWRSTILENFVPNVAKLTLVSDPDCLLTEEKLAMGLRDRGFDLIEFNDPMEFRYAYESKYRSIWDWGEYTDLVVVLRLQNAELESLPYDLLQAGRKLSFNLGDLFPNLSYPVIEKLDRGLLDLLYEAQRKSPPDRMGDNTTKDFILRHVFGVAPELISTEVELLRFLLRLHYGNLAIPSMLADRLVDVFESSGSFKGWSLSQIIPDAEQFFVFIQERWPIFLENLNQANQVKEDSEAYGLKFQGPVILPFDHQDIRVYIDNLFVEGKLTPVDLPGMDIAKDSWVLSGISAAKSDGEGLRLSRLFEIVDAADLSMDSRYTDWIAFAMKWAEISALIHTTSNARYKKRYSETGQKLNGLFADWLEAHYASLTNLPPSTPAMLHHVPRHLARSIEDQTSKKVVLVVIDGLSLDQWVTVRNIIQKQNSDLVLRESATFAWIPTLTSVSRQAIFSGKPPIYFPSSINSTNSEEKLWKQFWQGHDVSKLDIVYKRSLGDGDAEATMDSLINPAQTKVVGLVIDKVDKIMHGMQLGAAGMHNQIDQWCRGEYLISLLNYLSNHNYEVWITSDHGNVESIGKGRPTEGSIAESRGERVRIYPTPELRSQVSSRFPFAREWPPSGLPDDYFPLVATGNDAFVNEGDSIVGHGGVAIEEVIVPLIKVERRTQ